MTRPPGNGERAAWASQRSTDLSVTLRTLRLTWWIASRRRLVHAASSAQTDLPLPSGSYPQRSARAATIISPRPAGSCGLTPSTILGGDGSEWATVTRTPDEPVRTSRLNAGLAWRMALVGDSVTTAATRDQGPVLVTRWAAD